MADNNNSLIIINSINELYKIESSIAITNSSESFKAVEISTGRSVILSVLKRKFNVYLDPKEISQFLDRLNKIQTFGSSLSSLISFGVDKDGVGYSVCAISSVNSVLSGTINYGEATRRLEAVLQILMKMHKADIACGDICNDSFFISREGNIGLLAINGTYPRKSDENLTNSHYALPDIHEPISILSDIYRLGILSYKLFLNDYDAYPFDENNNYIQLISLNCDIPSYIDLAIKTCLSVNPEGRFSNAEELFNYIKSEREKDSSNDNSLTSINPTNDEFSKVKVLNEIALREEVNSKNKKMKATLGIVGVVLIVFLVIIFLSQNRGRGNNGVLNMRRNTQTSESQLREQEEKLKRIYDSEDPLMYVAMVNMANKALNPQQRKLVEKYIVKRFKNYQYDNLVVILEDFLSSIVGNEIPEFYEKLLLALDKKYPIEKRVVIFKELSKNNKSLIVDLAIALSLDDNNEKSYRDVFVSFLDDEFKKDIQRRSFDALLIAEYFSWQKYESLLKEKLTKLSDEDLVWIVPIFVKRNDKYLENVIDLITKRHLLDDVQSSFLSLINELNPPKEIKDILLKASTSQITQNDIQVVSNWININKEKILYVMILALKTDISLKREIFDIFSVTRVQDELINKYVKFVKENLWNNRGELTTLIPYLLKSKDYSEDKLLNVIKYSIKKLSSSDKSKILTELVEIADDKIKTIIFENFYEDLGVGVLVNYLSYDDKNIKKLALKGLKESGIDDIIISNLIIEKYDEEDDDEIRNMYKSNFWFIRKRELE